MRGEVNFCGQPRRPVAVLGATGIVGQRIIELLIDHPWFRVGELVASERSAGKVYGEIVNWQAAEQVPAEVAQLTVLGPGARLEARLVFSALDATAALRLEPRYAGRGHLVVSNAGAFRGDATVPLLIPEINPDALKLLERQEWAAVGGGIVTNPNCCVAGLALALAPLERRFGIEGVLVNTLQALSGAGYPGVSSLDVLGNVIPFIPGEEEKIEREPLKILNADFPIDAAVHRVPVRDGHTLTVHVKLKSAARIEEVETVLREFVGDAPPTLPSAPARPLHLSDDPTRPQPLHDITRGGGMTVTLGPITEDGVFGFRFTLVVHNTIRGAAGAALLNAELLTAREWGDELGIAAQAFGC
ncbi:MAG: aspartate-semialdehyde dehydrogenase [bacterium]|nr:aspartate-semialdehyde dehydrogenase [bacterium]